MQGRVDSETYDKSIDVLSEALDRARLRNNDRLACIRRLQEITGPSG